MNILIMMAGRGKRVENSYTKPKPLIPVGNKPMIKACIDSLNLLGNYIFVIRKYEDEEFNTELRETLLEFSTEDSILEVDYITEGPVSSALIAEDLINTDEPLIIANCDIIMEWESALFQQLIDVGGSDAIMVTYPDSTPANSYIKVNDKGIALEVAEKKVISSHSLTGIHYFAKGGDFVRASKTLIEKDIRVNGEYYVSMAVEEMVLAGKTVTIHEVAFDQHWPIGIPEDIEKYLAHLKQS